MMKRYSVISFLIVLAFLVSSCNVDAGNAGSIDLSGVQDNQKKILKKLEAIEKTQLGIKTSIAAINKSSAGASKKQQKPQADPNKVYDIAIGDSYVMGNKNAPITIIEWMDFQ